MEKNQDTQINEKALDLTLNELKKQFPGTTMLDIRQTAKAYNLKNVQSIYNCLRKGAPNPFPVQPKRRCGKLYWNIVQIAQDMAS